MSQEQRRDFWIYLDEFQNFITPSMAEILSGARKYRIGLILAHQELHQLQRDTDVASAVMSNPYTRVVFRVGDADANVLSKGFASFEARDLQNLEVGEAICRVERSDFDFNLSVPLPEEPDPALASETRNRVVTASREKFASPRAEVEAALSRAADVESPSLEPRLKRAASPKRVESEVAPEATPAVEAPPVVKPARYEPIAEVPKPVLLPGEGIGGAQHQATQKRIKEAAEELGFLAVIEKQIPNGSVDLWLQRDGFAVACEISVTTTIDHEFRNVRKCLDVDCAQVAVISSKASRLQQIREAVLAALGPEAGARVGYYTPDDFIAWLNSLPPIAAVSISTEPTVTMRRGRKVTRRSSSLTPEERKQKEAERIALIAEVMGNKR